MVKTHAHQLEGTQWKVIILAFTAMTGSAFSLGFVMPLCPPLVRHLGYAENQIGFYTGLVSGARFIGTIPGSILWGWLTTKLSCKRCIIVGLLGMGVCAFLFGFSFNLVVMIALRILAGFCDSVVCCARGVVHNACTDRSQAMAMSILNSAWGVGIVLACVISGPLMQESVPKRTTLVEIFPAIYGTTTVSCVLIALAILMMFLLPTDVGRVRESAKLPDSNSTINNCKFSRDETLLQCNNGTTQLSQTNTNSMPVLTFKHSGKHLVSSRGQYRSLSHLPLAPYDDCIDLCENNTECDADNTHAVDVTPDNNNAAAADGYCTLVKDVLTCRESRLGLVLYSIHGILLLASDEILSVFLQTNTINNGLGVSPSLVGMVVQPTFLIATVLQLLTVPLMQRYLGTIGAHHFFNCLGWATFVSIPFAFWLVGSLGMWLFLFPVIVFFRLGTGSGMTLQYMLLQNSVDRHHATTIAALSLTVGGVLRYSGSSLGGAMFALSISDTSRSYPLDYNMSFQLFGVLYIVCSIILNLMPFSMNKIKK